MDLVVMSQVTDWAIGLGFSFGAIKHFYPPQWDCTQGNFRAGLGTRFVVVNQILPTVVTLQCIPGIGRRVLPKVGDEGQFRPRRPVAERCEAEDGTWFVL